MNVWVISSVTYGILPPSCIPSPPFYLHLVTPSRTSCGPTSTPDPAAQKLALTTTLAMGLSSVVFTSTHTHMCIHQLDRANGNSHWLFRAISCSSLGLCFQGYGYSTSKSAALRQTTLGPNARFRWYLIIIQATLDCCVMVCNPPEPLHYLETTNPKFPNTFDFGYEAGIASVCLS